MDYKGGDTNHLKAIHNYREEISNSPTIPDCEQSRSSFRITDLLDIPVSKLADTIFVDGCPYICNLRYSDSYIQSIPDLVQGDKLLLHFILTHSLIFPTGVIASIFINKYMDNFLHANLYNHTPLTEPIIRASLYLCGNTAGSLLIIHFYKRFEEKYSFDPMIEMLTSDMLDYGTHDAVLACLIFVSSFSDSVGLFLARNFHMPAIKDYIEDHETISHDAFLNIILYLIDSPNSRPDSSFHPWIEFVLAFKDDIKKLMRDSFQNYQEGSFDISCQNLNPDVYIDSNEQNDYEEELFDDDYDNSFIEEEETENKEEQKAKSFGKNFVHDFDEAINFNNDSRTMKLKTFHREAPVIKIDSDQSYRSITLWEVISHRMDKI